VHVYAPYFYYGLLASVSVTSEPPVCILPRAALGSLFTVEEEEDEEEEVVMVTLETPNPLPLDASGEVELE